MLIAVTDVVSPVLADLFNRCFSCAIFPDCFKIARVKAVFKSVDNGSVNNIRPISIFNKFYERLVQNRILDFLNDNNIVSEHQFGFKKKSSTYICNS